MKKFPEPLCGAGMNSLPKTDTVCIYGNAAALLHFHFVLQALLLSGYINTVSASLSENMIMMRIS